MLTKGQQDVEKKSPVEGTGQKLVASDSSLIKQTV
jgi:hypothetical protein